jgi:hypothetical protein
MLEISYDIFDLPAGLDNILYCYHLHLMAQTDESRQNLSADHQQRALLIADFPALPHDQANSIGAHDEHFGERPAFNRLADWDGPLCAVSLS